VFDNFRGRRGISEGKLGLKLPINFWKTVLKKKKIKKYCIKFNHMHSMYLMQTK
jgi:hypothetical protein